MKRCCHCKQTKQLHEFHKNRARPDGLALACRSCNKETQRRYLATHKDQQRISNKRSVARRKVKDPAGYKRYRRNGELKHKYGITHEEYQRRLMQQEGVCAVCKKPETKLLNGRFIPLSVDHSHKTGKVRDLLCNKCNSAIGFLNDDPQLATAIADYLQRHAE